MGAEEEERALASLRDTTGVKGVVLAGSYEWTEGSLESICPRPLLPVALQPLIGYSLRWLSDSGVAAASICINRATQTLPARLEGSLPRALRVDYVADVMPRGAAGCIRDAGLGDAHTLVVTDGTAVPSVALDRLLDAHARSGAVLTVVVNHESRAGGREAYLSPAGVYVVDQRALEHVGDLGFHDIKESLIPKLHAAGAGVATYVANGSCPRVLNAQTYLAVNQWMVGCLTEQVEVPEGFVSFGYALGHTSVRVSHSARLVGPVLLGPNVRVAEDATIVGPCVLGEGTTVGEGALVSRTVTWRGAAVGAGAVVDQSVLSDHAVVEPRGRVAGVVHSSAGRPPFASTDVTQLGASLRPLPAILYPRAFAGVVTAPADPA